MIVKSCFAMRVWMFSKKNIYITGVICIMIVTQFGLALSYCVNAFRLPSLIQVHELSLVASLALGGGLATDVVIAIALCYFLRRLRTGFQRSDNLVNMLCIYAVNTGALTGAISLLTLVLYNARMDTFYFMPPYFTLGKFYAISFLCTLNTRKVTRGRGTDHQGNSINPPSNGRHPFVMVTNNGRTPRSHEYSEGQAKSVEIDVRQEVSVMSDLERAAQNNPMACAWSF
ncbi:hypothetical protein M413DRAFT_26241 [Hebeloma cylindrosporum]|uniref:DUF6534 domain-containing protein n=1 Tax=Hebeloma cylindrosporum TaxID=76867 RepID=A0A0C3CHD2_HEBCY|nr:hypothetical protein M413DRAFT_26241 [Hebeloma cylindrosporum h7]